MVRKLKSLVKNLKQNNYTAKDIILCDRVLDISDILLHESSTAFVPHVISINNLYSNYFELLNIAPTLPAIEEIVLDDMTFNIYISKALVISGVSYRAQDVYSNFIQSYLKNSPHAKLDDLKNELQNHISSDNIVLKVSNALFDQLKQNNSIPIIIAEKIMAKNLAEHLSSSKFFMHLSASNHPKYLSDLIQKLETLAFISSNAPSSLNHDNKLIECANEIEERNILLMITKEYLNKGYEKIAIIGCSHADQILLKSHFTKSGIPFKNDLKLIEQPSAAFFIMLAKLCISEEITPLDLSSVLNHPSSIYFHQPWYHMLETRYLRAPLVWKTIPQLIALIKEDDIQEFLTDFHLIISAFKCADLETTIHQHLQIFQKLFNGDSDDCFDLYSFLEDISQGDLNFNLPPAEYIAFISDAIANQTIRTKDKAQVFFCDLKHALFMQPDLYLLSNFNEGTYPPSFKSNNLLPKEILSALSIPSEESLQHEFDCLINELTRLNFIITRSKSVSSVDTISSRYMDHFTTVNEHEYNEIFRYYYYNNEPTTIEQNYIIPPENMLPTEISVSGIEKLIRSPYAFYAEYILKLRQVDPIGVSVGPRELGIVIHSILSKIDFSLPKDIFIAEFNNYFITIFKHENAAIKELQRKRINNIAQRVYDIETLRHDVVRRLNEINGAININEVIVKARADRINILDNGNAEIVDFKTGYTPSKREVEDGSYPQLAIEALIAKQGGFGEKIDKASIKYVALKGRGEIVEETEFEINLDTVLESLEALIAIFWQDQTPFYIGKNAGNQNKIQAYQHLSRNNSN